MLCWRKVWQWLSLHYYLERRGRQEAESWRLLLPAKVSNVPNWPSCMKQPKVSVKIIWNNDLKTWNIRKRTVIPWRWKTNKMSPATVPAYYLESFLAAVKEGEAEIDPSQLLELKKWSWEPRETKPARVHTIEYQRGKSSMEREPWRLVGQHLCIFIWVLINVCTWRNGQGWALPSYHLGLGTVPIPTTQAKKIHNLQAWGRVLRESRLSTEE